ncbi:hypothetical protein B0H17DRAFT_1146406 [Mycena rosella]|uniref:Uncharacterized protein n=1 Tax=Mycena rosella TaxID=1033263 RepID=A0AAD7CNY9_MYCRO|nr:hypothetical protein B0H17DRAFT_1146406 [Mycena rosella]
MVKKAKYTTKDPSGFRVGDIVEMGFEVVAFRQANRGREDKHMDALPRLLSTLERTRHRWFQRLLLEGGEAKFKLLQNLLQGLRKKPDANCWCPTGAAMSDIVTQGQFEDTCTTVGSVLGRKDSWIAHLISGQVLPSGLEAADASSLVRRGREASYPQTVDSGDGGGREIDGSVRGFVEAMEDEVPDNEAIEIDSDEEYGA